MKPDENHEIPHLAWRMRGSLLVLQLPATICLVQATELLMAVA